MVHMNGLLEGTGICFECYRRGTSNSKVGTHVFSLRGDVTKGSVTILAFKRFLSSVSP